MYEIGGYGIRTDSYLILIQDVCSWVETTIVQQHLTRVNSITILQWASHHQAAVCPSIHGCLKPVLGDRMSFSCGLGERLWYLEISSAVVEYNFRLLASKDNASLYKIAISYERRSYIITHQHGYSFQFTLSVFFLFFLYKHIYGLHTAHQVPRDAFQSHR